jgi:hypothetical protein
MKCWLSNGGKNAGAMRDYAKQLYRRVESLRLRIENLAALRVLVALPPELDISARQWNLLEAELKVIAARLLSPLNRGARAYLEQSQNRLAAQALNALLGKCELELSKAYTFFDTYMDVLTQRRTPELGRLLAGCDVLAHDGLKKNHPALALIEAPLVYCDRGFGASTLREGIRIAGRSVNPMPLVQIPYSRLKEKYNLTSILHEVGHEAMVRLGLRTALPKAFRQALARAGAPAAIQDLFALWSTEIGPDFWTFCCCGLGAAGALREILALPPQHIFHLSWTDPHPMPYLRILLATDWCRQQWGSGLWDEWEKEWQTLYPLPLASSEAQEFLVQGLKYLPVISRVLLHGRFPSLHGKTIPSYFNFEVLSPIELQRRLPSKQQRTLNLKGLPPAAQLAVFRLVKEQGTLAEAQLDEVMKHWLLRLAVGRKVSHQPVAKEA